MRKLIELVVKKVADPEPVAQWRTSLMSCCAVLT